MKGMKSNYVFVLVMLVFAFRLLMLVYRYQQEIEHSCPAADHHRIPDVESLLRSALLMLLVVLNTAPTTLIIEHFQFQP